MMSSLSMTFDEFRDIARPGVIIPVSRRLNADFLTPVIAYLKLRDKKNASFLLESVIKGEQLGRYSFIGCSPFKICRAIIQGNGAVARSVDGNFFDEIRSNLGEYELLAAADLPRFTCGAVGFIGYDMIRQIENIPEATPSAIDLPDSMLGFYRELIAFDHLKNEVILIVNVFVDDNAELHSLYRTAEEKLDILLRKLNRPVNFDLNFSAKLNKLKGHYSKAGFQEAVEKAKEYIYAGDIFQVVLSQRMEVPFKGDVFQVYRALRSINPSPYLFFLDFLDYQLIGSSPEPLIRVENRRAEIIPIAGTRPRGKTSEEDQVLSESLLRDPKELAEHVMLVDLARNDMGKVSQFGSVQVDAFQTLEKYSHVMHIISRVNGYLREEYDAIDAFKAAFPAGTVSGAPKIRAMEIINQLEPEKRGFYAGAIGYFDYQGNMDMCIAIRTMLASRGKIYLQAGAGIVADSVPEKEYEETLNKAKALKKAIEQASGGIHDFVYR